MYRRFVALVLSFTALVGLSKTYAQNALDEFDVEFHGFINYEAYFDNRAMVASREGEICLYPKAPDFDSLGVDKNDVGTLNMLTFFTRMNANISAPDFMGAKVNGKIEFDFLGTGEDYVNLLRMRHAFIKLDWQKYKLLFGQYWHPMFVPECYPKTISAGAGLPIHVLSRNPQIRFSYLPIDNLEFNFAALSQRDFSSKGPDGTTGDYLRRSKVPDLQFQIMVGNKKEFLVGSTVGYRQIVPRLVSEEGFAVDESLGSINLNIFTTFNIGSASLRLQGIYGENMSNFVQMGGYGVTQTIDPVTGEQGYTNTSTLTFWGDADFNITDHLKVGAFAGISNNQGSSDVVDDPSVVYGTAMDIDRLVRLMPRISYRSNDLRFGFEVCYTTADYGDRNEQLEVVNTETVEGTRYLFSVSKFF
jgi:hypothetical protein